jgi:7SK snRNA methylphosphate capping enzyme
MSEDANNVLVEESLSIPSYSEEKESTVLVEETLLEESAVLPSTQESTVVVTTSSIPTPRKRKHLQIEESQQTDHEAPKRKKTRNNPQFPYGNYNDYYKVRYKDYTIDSRVLVIQQQSQYDFNDKTCLDIGCNTGFLTLQIAQNLNVKSIVGVDIDPGLIRKAKKNVKQLLTDHSTLQQQFLVANTKSEEKQDRARFVASTNQKLQDQPVDNNEYLNRVEFKAQNFITAENETEKCDVIFCMSVSKWIHLNHGDDGIRTLFSKVHQMLNPGGLFVFEPQLWKSYSNKTDMTTKMQKIFKSIKFKPTQFNDYLLKDVKFARGSTHFAYDKTSSSSSNSSETTDDKAKHKNKKKANHRPICFYYKE